MSTPRRALGTGPMNTSTTSSTQERAPRLLPVELAGVDERQEHRSPVRQVDDGPAPSRRKLGGRGQ